MTHDPRQLASPPSPPFQPEEFIVFHWMNPATHCEFAYLATNAERSVLFSFGEHSLCVDFKLPDDTECWLTDDYAPTGERITVNIEAVRYLLDQTFTGGAVCSFVKFGEDLAIQLIDLSLVLQKTAEGGPEYVISGLGDYKRWYREPNRYRAVSMAERAMLDVCCATFATLANEHRHLITAPETPKFRGTKESGVVH